jgi:hypothetical protein
MRAFNRFDVEIEASSRGIGADGGISGVCERAGLSTAETRDVVLIATENLIFSSLEFETAKVGSNNRPHEIV